MDINILSNVSVVPWRTGRVFGHKSIAFEFKSRTANAQRVVHLSVRLITFYGGSAHLAHPVH